MLKTYDSRKVLISLGSHNVTGYSDDSFVSIEPNGDGVVKKVGCDSEVIRSIDPDDTANMTLTLLQQSPTISFCQKMYDRDRADGTGTFSVLVKDLKGGLIFSAQDAWVVTPMTRDFAKEAPDREISIQCGAVEYSGENEE